MDHFEALSHADAWAEGRLDAATGTALRAHMDACPTCRGILQQWPLQAPVPDLWPGLRERILPAPALWGPAWLTPALAAAALLLCVSAFWHPERAWLRADQAWAYEAPSFGAQP